MPDDATRIETLENRIAVLEAQVGRLVKANANPVSYITEWALMHNASEEQEASVCRLISVTSESVGKSDGPGAPYFAAQLARIVSPRSGYTAMMEAGELVVGLGSDNKDHPLYKAWKPLFVQQS